MIRWLIHEAWEKINVVATWRQLKRLGKKYGKRFFWAALIWEIIEDVIFPFISWRMGVPELIPVFLVLHFEPIVYPAFFWGFRTWDRVQGKEPWEPNRDGYSSHWRSFLKGMIFHLSITGWLSHLIDWKPLVIVAILMCLFGFIHERIWHDTNYGILGNDQVQFKRVLAKTGTYLLISTITFYSLLKVTGASPLWQSLLVSQGMTGALYLVLESVWSRSMWGVYTQTKP